MDSSAFLIDHPSLAFSMSDVAPAVGGDVAPDTLPMLAGAILDDAPLAVSLSDATMLAPAQGFAEFMDSISAPDDTRRTALSLLIRSHRNALTDLSRLQRELLRARARCDLSAADLADAVDLGGLLTWSLALTDRSLEVAAPLATLFGWDAPQDHRGRSMSDLIEQVAADDRERFRAMLMQVLRRGVAERGEVGLLESSQHTHAQAFHRVSAVVEQLDLRVMFVTRQAAQHHVTAVNPQQALLALRLEHR